MSPLTIEGLKIYGIKHVAEDSILDPEDLVSKPSCIHRAEHIAILIREKIGTNRLGTTWTEKSLELSDKRRVRVQVSDDALEIAIGATHDTPFETLARWNRIRNILISIGTWDQIHRLWLTYYQISESTPSIPATFSYARASDAFSVILGQIEQGIKIESEQSQLLSPPPTRSNLELTVAERVI